MQIKGTAAVTQNSQVVTAAVGSDWSQAIVGGMFSLDAGALSPIYDIADVRPPGDPDNTSAGGAQWQIVLTGNYVADTNAAAAILICISFFSQGVPILNDGDTNTLGIINRAFAKLNNALAQSIGQLFSNARPSPTTGKFQLYNPDQNVSHTLQVSGLPGFERLDIVTPGEAGGVGVGSFANIRNSPSDGSFQVFNPDQNKFFTIRVRGLAGVENTEIVQPGEI